jgi:hypothetical protein
MHLPIQASQNDFPGNGSVSNKDMFSEKMDISFGNEPFAVASLFEAHQLETAACWSPASPDARMVPRRVLASGLLCLLAVMIQRAHQAGARGFAGRSKTCPAQPGAGRKHYNSNVV